MDDLLLTEESLKNVEALLDAIDQAGRPILDFIINLEQMKPSNPSRYTFITIEDGYIHYEGISYFGGGTDSNIITIPLMSILDPEAYINKRRREATAEQIRRENKKLEMALLIEEKDKVERRNQYLKLRKEFEPNNDTPIPA